GNDPGALGNGLREKDITLAITKKVGNILERHGVKVFYTRTNDKTVSLEERTKRANRNKADIFVSIHTNAFDKKSAKGLETYHFPGSKNGRKLANCIQKRIKETGLYNSDRGVKTARFWVLRKTTMPSALTEMAFITNAQDAKLLRNKQSQFATAIAKGILDYFGIKYKTNNNNKNKSNSKGLYKVQVGAFKDKKNAKKLAKELKKKGYSNFIKKE